MIYVILGTGFEELEAIATVDVLRRCGAEVCTAGIGGRQIEGSHGIVVTADITVEEISQDQLEMIVLPGGLGGVASISASECTMQAVRKAFDDGKYVAAICAGPTVLAKLGITNGRRVTSYPGTESQMGDVQYVNDKKVVVDGRLITSRGPGTAVDFGLELGRILCGDAVMKQVAEGMLLA